ncbi:MAG TPA: sigma-70 family RNA polymerase sigma factor [bacterium]|nr:sigma-70 family RNA polymerase sigma factor [bacterium]
MHPTRILSPRTARDRAGSAEAWTGLPGGLPQPVYELASDGAIADAELVRLTLSGKDDAFAALVARYQKRAFWIAFHVVGRVEDARDISQDAFVRLYRSLARYDFARSFYTWFYRIVMNLAIDLVRKQKTARARSLEDHVTTLADERADEAFRPVERKEERDLVWAVLDKLDAKFRAVLVMRDIHGLTCREIAPILKVTHATARWRLHRGRQIFRAHWVKQAEGAGE